MKDSHLKRTKEAVDAFMDAFYRESERLSLAIVSILEEIYEEWEKHKVDGKLPDCYEEDVSKAIKLETFLNSATDTDSLSEMIWSLYRALDIDIDE